MNPTSRSAEAIQAANRAAARTVATRLARDHAALGWDHLFSAALKLIEAGEKDPRDRRVLAEARQRFRRLREAAIVQFRRFGDDQAVAEMEADIARVCGQTTKGKADAASTPASTRDGEPDPGGPGGHQASDPGWTDGRDGSDFRMSTRVRDDGRG